MKVSAFFSNKTVILMIFTIFINITSFFKNIIIAFFYGTNVEYDILIVAQFIPLFLSGLIMGSLQGVLIPVLISCKEKYGVEQSIRIYKSTSLLILIITTMVSVLFLLLSSNMLKMLPVGFSPEQFNLFVSLSNASIMILLLNSAVVLLRNLYNANQKYAIPSIATLVGYVASILYILFDPTKDMFTLCYSLLLGAVIEIIMLGSLLSKSDIQIPQGFKFNSPEVKKALWLILPVMMSSTLSGANLFIGQIMASHLYEGAVSSLNYAEKLDSTFRQIFILTLSTTLFSTFSELVAKKDFTALKSKANQLYRVYGMILLPITVYVVLFSPIMVKLLFERGAFTEVSTQYTASVWAIYSIRLYILLCSMISERVYNSLQDAKYQVIVSSIGLFLNIMLNLLFMNLYGHNGIAISTVLTTCATTALLYYFMTRLIGSVITKQTIIFLCKVLLANICIFIIGYLINLVVEPAGTGQSFIWLATSFFIHVSGVILLYKLFGIDYGVLTRSVFVERVRREV